MIDKYVQLAYERGAWKNGTKSFHEAANFLESFQFNTKCTDEQLTQWSQAWLGSEKRQQAKEVLCLTSNK